MEDNHTNPEDFEIKPVMSLIKRLPKFFSISVASKRNSGKSVLIQEVIKLLLKMKKVDIVIVMSGSAGLNSDYDFLPDSCLMNYSDSMLSGIYNKQKTMKINEVMKTKQNLKMNKKEKTPHILVVLDDCLSNQEALSSNVVNQCYAEGRHSNISIIVISQHTALLLDTIKRGNSDIILWNKLNLQQLERLWFSTTHITKKDFIAVSEYFGGQNYNFLVLDTYIHSKDPAEFLSVIRAVVE